MISLSILSKRPLIESTASCSLSGMLSSGVFSSTTKRPLYDRYCLPFSTFAPCVVASGLPSFLFDGFCEIYLFTAVFDAFLFLLVFAFSSTTGSLFVATSFSTTGGAGLSMVCVSACSSGNGAGYSQY